VRQQNLKTLAAAADARWASKPSVLDAPVRERGQPRRMPEVDEASDSSKPQETRDPRSSTPGIGGAKVGGSSTSQGPITEGRPPEYTGEMQVPDGIRHHFVERSEEGSPKLAKKEEDPWKQARGGPSEGWQPKAWDGNPVPPTR